MVLNERLSNSRTFVYGKCRKAYAFQYCDKLSPAPGTVSADKWLKRGRGILIHAGCEAGWRGRALADGIEDELRELENKGHTDWAEAGRGVASECAQVAQDLLDWMPMKDFEPLMVNGQLGVEVELSCPVPGFKDFVAYADLVVKHKSSGRVFISDYKSTERFKSPESERFRMQLILYAYALKHMGIKVDGALIWQCKPELPRGKPRNIRIDEGGIEGPRDSVDGRFRMTPTFYPESYIENVWRNFEKTALEMSQFDASKGAYIEMNDFSCQGCDFLRLCQAELSGADVDWVRNTQFLQRGQHTKRSTQLNIVI